MGSLFHTLSVLILLSFSGISASVSEEPANSYKDSQGVVVVLAALDKITTRLTTIEVARDQMVRFGTLEITMRSCRSNPPEETPENVAYLEILDVGHDQQTKKYFSGWMFSSSPALSPLEHPVYDVWVMDCKTRSGPMSKDAE